MIVELRAEAIVDLKEAADFYELKEDGLGAYFEDHLFDELEQLRVYGLLLSSKFLAFHRTFSDRFPYAIYFTIRGERIIVHAVLDCRRRPSWTARKLRSRDA